MIEGPEEISEGNFVLMRSIVRALESACLPGLVETVSAYRSVLALFDTEFIGMEDTERKIAGLLDSLSLVPDGGHDVVEIPVCYGSGYDPDLDEVAQRAGLSREEVISIHSGGLYRVFMIGFTPGFPYLGGMSEKIATPRRKDPRVRIEAGSVGIADSQTGVYPIASPGGWNIIGRTPLALFDPEREPAALLRAGQFVRFVPIDDTEYCRFAGTLAQAGTAVRDAEMTQTGIAVPALSGAISGIEVVAPGMLTTIQDSGRHGYQFMGVPPSGAMDLRSLELANIAVGNDPGEAGLEMTILGPELRFDAESIFALSGGKVDATLSGSPVPMFEAVSAAPGDILAVGQVFSGMRCYLAISGGFDTAIVMGSRSTYVRGGFGGFRGRAIKAGDYLGLRGSSTGGIPVLYTSGSEGRRTIPEFLRPAFRDSYELRVVVSHEGDRFSTGAMQVFFSTVWPVAAKSDRMGIRLDGASLEHSRGADIISSGVLTGTIQVPGQGNPIILAADRQTTGGYSRIAHVCAVDLPVLGRMKAGDRISFRSIGVDEARRLASESAASIRNLTSGKVDDAGFGESTVGRSGITADTRSEKQIASHIVEKTVNIPDNQSGTERFFRVVVNGHVYSVGVAEVG